MVALTSDTMSGGQMYDVASTVLAAIFWTRSVWALAVGRIVSELFRTIWSYWIAGKHGYRPRFILEKNSVHALVTFGRWILIGTVLTFLAQQSDRLILSKLTTLTMLGIYNIAFQLSDDILDIAAARRDSRRRLHEQPGPLPGPDTAH